MTNRRGKGGFTLVELAVTLVILSILFAIAVPNLLGYIHLSQFRRNESCAKTMYLSAESALTYCRTGGEWESFCRRVKDEGVLIEQRITDFNHLEVQIVSDRSGKNPVHFGTRNCSIQSTGLQKRVEVAPGFVPAQMDYSFDAAKVLQDIVHYSLTMARKVGYDNVGTWEWIVTRQGEPFLMEVNTRIQVENGVSARISSIRNHEGPVDLIAEQIRIGLGEPLGYTQDDVTFDGVGIEYRLIAEDPEHGFTPWVGRIEHFAWKEEPWLTMLTHVPTDTPYEIPTEFDPNLALAIIWGKDLAEARERGVSFLDNLHLEGRNNAGEALKSNVDFLRANTARTLRF